MNTCFLISLIESKKLDYIDVIYYLDEDTDYETLIRYLNKRINLAFLVIPEILIKLNSIDKGRYIKVYEALKKENIVYPYKINELDKINYPHCLLVKGMSLDDIIKHFEDQSLEIRFDTYYIKKFLIWLLINDREKCIPFLEYIFKKYDVLRLPTLVAATLEYNSDSILQKDIIDFWVEFMDRVKVSDYYDKVYIYSPEIENCYFEKYSIENGLKLKILMPFKYLFKDRLIYSTFTEKKVSLKEIDYDKWLEFFKDLQSEKTLIITPASLPFFTCSLNIYNLSNPYKISSIYLNLHIGQNWIKLIDLIYVQDRKKNYVFPNTSMSKKLEEILRSILRETYDYIFNNTIQLKAKVISENSYLLGGV